MNMEKSSILPVSNSFCKVYTWECKAVSLPNPNQGLRVVWWHHGDVPGLFTFSPSLLLGQVLSHNLYTVLCIPHDPVALEEHFRDDDDGPVSSQGYMPYLNKYILDKVSPLANPAITCWVPPGLLPWLLSPLLLEIPCLDVWKRDTGSWEHSGECQTK